MPGEGLRGRHLEAGPVADADLGRPLARRFDRLGVVVRADDRGLRECLRDENSGGAEPAADVGHPTPDDEPRLDPTSAGIHSGTSAAT